MKNNSSLVAKSNARLAAAQLLYNAAITGETLNAEKLAKEYARYLGDTPERKKEAVIPSTPPNNALLKKLLSGMEQHDSVLEDVLVSLLKDGWKRERISPLMASILKLGLLELDQHRELATAVIVNEYTTLARRFFEDDEVNFVHAALSEAAKKFRT